MARVEERIHIHRPVGQVWDLLTRWEDQPEWMVDAKSVTVTSESRTGTGVTISVPTNIALGVVVTDEMAVTEWVPRERIAVVHTGWLIKGHGAFELAPTDRGDGLEGTIFTWWEQIDAPLGRLGEFIAANIAVPYVSRIFRRSLRQLKVVAEAEAEATR